MFLLNRVYNSLSEILVPERCFIAWNFCYLEYFHILIDVLWEHHIFISFFSFYIQILTHSKRNFLTLFPRWLCYDCRLSHEDFCGLILTCECFSSLNLSDLPCFICVNIKGTMKAKGPYYSLPVPENSFSRRKQWSLF